MKKTRTRQRTETISETWFCLFGVHERCNPIKRNMRTNSQSFCQEN